LIIYRYILREHIAPFIFGNLLIIFIFTMNLVFQMLGRIAGKGLPVPVVLEYFALNLAWIVTLAVPMAVLIATVAAFGRMAGDGEITALRSSGVSPARLMLPVMAAAVVVTALIGLFNNYILPDMNHRTKLLLSDISRKKPTLTIEPGVYSFTIPNYVLMAGVVDQMTGRMERVTIYDEHEPSKRATVVAQDGRLKFVAEDEVILLTLYNGEIQRPSEREPGGFEWTTFDSALFRIPAPEMVLKRGTAGYRGDRELSVEEMLARVKELKKSGGDYDHRRSDAYMVEVHKKFAIPAACMVFVLLGAPLGILAHRGGMGVSGGISLLFFTIYWAFLANGEDLADRNILSPAVAMWGANVLLTIVGIWFLWLAKRRTSLPAVGWVWQRVQKLFRLKAGAEGRRVK